MRFEVSETDFKLLTSVMRILKEKGGHNPSVTRHEIVEAVGISNARFSQKLYNLHLKEKQLKELIP